MYKWILILLLIILGTPPMVGQTSRFSRVFEDASGNKTTGATIYIVHQVTGDSLLLTEHATKAGLYQRDNVKYGEYKVYVNSAKIDENIFFGAKRQYSFIEGVDPDGNNKINQGSFEADAIISANIAAESVTNGKLASSAITTSKLADNSVTSAKVASNAVTTSAVADSQITPQKLSTSVHALINGAGGGTINNNPDEEYLTTNASSEMTPTQAMLDTLHEARNKLNKMKIINARDFGVHPDSTGLANAINLQAAIDSAWNPATTDQRSRVFIPAGKYPIAPRATPATGHRYCVNIRSSLDIHGDGVSLDGHGAHFILDSASVASGDSITIFCDTGYYDKFVAKTGAPAGYWWHRASVVDVGVDCNGNDQAGHVTAFGVWQPGEASFMHRVYAKQIRGRGVYYSKPAPGFSMSNCSFFAADSADTVTIAGERIGVWHADGSGNFDQISGDILHPLHYIEDANANIIITNGKFESGNPGLFPIVHNPTAIYVKNISLGGLIVDMMRADRTTANYVGNVVEVYGATSGDKPNVLLRGIKHTGFKNLLYWNINGVADSIKTSATGQGNFTPKVDFLNAPYTINGDLLFDYSGSGNGISMISHLDDDTIAVFEHKSDTKTRIRSVRNTLSFRNYQDTVIVEYGTNDAVFHKTLKTTDNAEIRAIHGLRVGGDGLTELDSMKVENHNFAFFDGSNQYNAFRSSNTMPSSGSYTLGDIVLHRDATEQGSASSKYVVTGWYRLTTGSNHVLNTDWVEMRVLTGN